MTEVKNLYLRFKKRYDGISENGSRPYINFDTINEHIKESPLIWGQFTKGKSDNLISKERIHELNKNKGYVFFISNDVSMVELDFFMGKLYIFIQMIVEEKKFLKVIKN